MCFLLSISFFLNLFYFYLFGCSEHMGYTSLTRDQTQAHCTGRQILNHWTTREGKSLSRVWLLATPWTATHQAPPSMGFSRQEYWSRVPLPSPCCGFRLPLKFLYCNLKGLPSGEELSTCAQSIIFPQKPSRYFTTFDDDGWLQIEESIGREAKCRA